MIAPVSLPVHCTVQAHMAPCRHVQACSPGNPHGHTVPTGGADIRGGPRDYPPTTIFCVLFCKFIAEKFTKEKPSEINCVHDHASATSVAVPPSRRARLTAIAAPFTALA